MLVQINVSAQKNGTVHIAKLVSNVYFYKFAYYRREVTGKEELRSTTRGFNNHKINVLL